MVPLHCLYVWSKDTLYGKLCSVCRSDMFFPSLANNLFCSASCIHWQMFPALGIFPVKGNRCKGLKKSLMQRTASIRAKKTYHNREHLSLPRNRSKGCLQNVFSKMLELLFIYERKEIFYRIHAQTCARLLVFRNFGNESIYFNSVQETWRVLSSSFHHCKFKKWLLVSRLYVLFFCFKVFT